MLSSALSHPELTVQASENTQQDAGQPWEVFRRHPQAVTQHWLWPVSVLFSINGTSNGGASSLPDPTSLSESQALWRGSL